MSASETEVYQMRTIDDFDRVIKESGYKLVVVHFKASHSGICRRLLPEIEELNKEYKGSVVFVKVDIESSSPLKKAHCVASAPTVQFYIKGRKYDELK